ncbi:heavy-metal-associated domain-containing protein [Loktanella sp. DJP18]|uniref:heavy-metal-associated domain-containing protein n=1 Tax=Loktanella sp. DJP18 TaxID=3409788 RepID=UPI003BB54B3F
MTTYGVPDMSCGHCKATIEQTVLAQDPGATMSFDMTARTVTVRTATDEAALLRSLHQAGYPATPV